MRLQFIICILLLIAIAAPGYAVTGYTNRTLFMEGIAGFPDVATVDFDSHTAPYPVTSYYKTLNISANGLDSDGSTPVTLSPIETDAFVTTSGSNSLGVSSLDHSFLAGNNDAITFTFSSPVSAIGMYLIGNPSPTGIPAIPFWRLAIRYGRLWYSVYSSTDPIQNLGVGSDVYFLGLVSIDKPFTEAVLFANNDLAAVFSFNVDDLVFAALPSLSTIPGIKSGGTSDDTITDAVVARVHADRFNIQVPGKPYGIAVVGSGAVRGNTISLWGTPGLTADDERVVNLGDIISQAAATPPAPMGMTTTSAGGGADAGLQVGVDGAFGPNNVGLDVTIWGTITGKADDDTWFTVDDGAGRISGQLDNLGEMLKGVKVLGGVNIGKYRSVGDFVIVRGSSSLWKSGTQHFPLIKVASPYDLQPSIVN